MIWLPASWYSKYINRQEVSKSPKMPILPIEMELRKKKKVVHGGKGSLGTKWPDLCILSKVFFIKYAFRKIDGKLASLY